MTLLRKSEDRGHANHGWLDARHSFSFARYYDPAYMGFRSLRVLNEDRVQPGTGFPKHPHDNMEIVTYIIDGELTHRDSTGAAATLRRGDVQAMSAGRGVIHSEVNESETDPVHLIQIWLEPAERNTDPSHAEAHFGDDRKRGRLQPIASPDGRDGSLRIGQDAVIYSSLLGAGDSLRFATEDGRRHVWIQLIRGALEVDGETLSAGDAVGLNDTNEVSLTGVGEAEFLLFDLA